MDRGGNTESEVQDKVKGDWMLIPVIWSSPGSKLVRREKYIVEKIAKKGDIKILFHLLKSIHNDLKINEIFCIV